MADLSIGLRSPGRICMRVGLELSTRDRQTRGLFAVVVAADQFDAQLPLARDQMIREWHFINPRLVVPALKQSSRDLNLGAIVWGFMPDYLRRWRGSIILSAVRKSSTAIQARQTFFLCELGRRPPLSGCLVFPAFHLRSVFGLLATRRSSLDPKRAT